MRIHLIYQDGKYENVIVSKDNPTYVVNPNIWFAAEVIPEEGDNLASFKNSSKNCLKFAKIEFWNLKKIVKLKGENVNKLSRIFFYAKNIFFETYLQILM